MLYDMLSRGYTKTCSALLKLERLGLATLESEELDHGCAGIPSWIG